MGINRKMVAALLGSAVGALLLLVGPGAPDSAAGPCNPDDMNWPCVQSSSSSMVVASGLDGGGDDTNW